MLAEIPIISPIFQGLLDARLRLVDARAGVLARFGRERAQRAQQRRQLAALAEIARLGVFQRCGIGGGAKLRERPLDDAVDVLHPRAFRNGVSARGWP